MCTELTSARVVISTSNRSSLVSLRSHQAYEGMFIRRILAYKGASSSMTYHHDSYNSAAHGDKGNLWLLKINSAYFREGDDVGES